MNERPIILFDRGAIARAVAGRAAEQKWPADRVLVISGICVWYADHPDASIGYEGGLPNDDMRRMIEGVAHGTHADARTVLSAFGAAHCLLCDTVPGFRPVLHSAWDRRAGSADHG